MLLIAAVARLKSDIPSERATSAGGIVIRDAAEGAELVLGKRRRDRDGVSWSLPKGTPEAGETHEQTALREVTEETGLEVRIVAPVGAIHYRFVREGRRIDKTVHYFLMEAVGGVLQEHDHEFEEVAWFSLAEAEAIMSFPTEKDIVARTLPVAGLE
ncbi:MAG: NUDIX hydrolase [Chloroflexota bacterium]